jgi:hypothetical protein
VASAIAIDCVCEVLNGWTVRSLTALDCVSDILSKEFKPEKCLIFLWHSQLSLTPAERDRLGPEDQVVNGRINIV